MMSRFERMERLIPEEGIARLERAHIAVFGVGGVGGVGSSVTSTMGAGEYTSMA